jgi:hypothetical protein
MPCIKSLALMLLLGATAASLGADSPAKTSSNPIDAASVNDWAVTLFLQDSELQLGRATRVVVEVTNLDPHLREVRNFVGLQVYTAKLDGAREPLRSTVPAGSKPPHPPAAVSDAPSAASPNVFVASIEVECPSSRDQHDAGDFGLHNNGKVIDHPLDQHRSILLSRPVQAWAFAPGECRVRAVLRQGAKVVAASQSRTIKVSESANDMHKVP